MMWQSRALAWARANLFSTPLNGAVTLAAFVLIARFAWGAFDWAILSAVFAGADGKACSAPGVGAVRRIRSGAT